VIKPDDPRRLAIDLLDRSICHVQVASVIADRHGIFSWGWNHAGSDGYGEHAEAAAFRRANKERLEWATLYVAARRSRTKAITARPCGGCQVLIKKWGIRTVWYRDETGWHKEEWL
jgi:tRNA(Arg) A34 adenosine deaminase TadA